jgi:hypothetical protein
MFKPGSLLRVLDSENLRRQAFPNEAFCHLKINAGSIGDELSSKISGLIPH